MRRGEWWSQYVDEFVSSTCVTFASIGCLEGHNKQAYCCYVVFRGSDVNVKRLPKRQAPPRFGKKLTEAQKVKWRMAACCFIVSTSATMSKSVLN